MIPALDAQSLIVIPLEGIPPGKGPSTSNGRVRNFCVSDHKPELLRADVHLSFPSFVHPDMRKETPTLSAE